MNATAARVFVVTALTTLALAAFTAPSSTWAAGVVTTCDDAHFTTALSGGGLVTFSCGGAATITVTGTKNISANTTIDGGGVIAISGGNSVQVFTVNSGATFTVQNLTIQNGSSAGFAGGITNNGTTVVTNCTFSGNTGGNGGAIFSGNRLTVTGSTFSGNSATVDGGAIYNNGTMTVTNSTFNGNSALAGANGGAIQNFFMANIAGSTISGNTAAAGGNGGGISNDSTMTITASVISGNSAGPADGNGGGIYNNASLTITDSTVSGNAAGVTGSSGAGGSGAGIYHNGNILTMNRDTVSGNTTPSGPHGAIFINGIGSAITNVTISGNTGGLFNNGNGVDVIATTIASNASAGVAKGGVNVNLTSTIIANNGVNCSGTVSDRGTNMQFPGTTCGGSITSADPLLQPLANNGGLTQTHALGAGSPAIDTGTAICPPTPPTDQRGVVRPQGAGCDIGAFELAAAGPPLPTLSIDSVSGTKPSSGTSPFVFRVTLSAASASTVTVNFTTANGTATAGSDYVATSGTLTFAPGVTTQPISVSVIGNTTLNPNRTFSVNLSSPTNATVAAGTGTGTIVSAVVVPPPSPNTPIPTLNDWGLAVLSMLVVLLALWSVRTRRR